jgi:hypothetical protein
MTTRGGAGIGGRANSSPLGLNMGVSRRAAAPAAAAGGSEDQENRGGQGNTQHARTVQRRFPREQPLLVQSDNGRCYVGPMGGRCFKLAALALGVGVLLLPSAASATTDRADYVAQADAACSSSFSFSLHAFKLAHRGGRAPDRKLIRGTLRAIRRSSKDYRRLTGQLSQIPPAPGDESLVAQWLGARINYQSFYGRGIQALREHRIRRLHHWAGEQQRYKKVVHAALNAFGSPTPFHYCIYA